MLAVGAASSPASTPNGGRTDEPWVVIALAGAGTFLLRISMLVLAARTGVPAVVERAAAFAVPVSFAGLAAGALATQATAMTAWSLPGSRRRRPSASPPCAGRAPRMPPFSPG